MRGNTPEEANNDEHNDDSSSTSTSTSTTATTATTTTITTTTTTHDNTTTNDNDSHNSYTTKHRTMKEMDALKLTIYKHTHTYVLTFAETTPATNTTMEETEALKL